MPLRGPRPALLLPLRGNERFQTEKPKGAPLGHVAPAERDVIYLRCQRGPKAFSPKAAFRYICRRLAIYCSKAVQSGPKGAFLSLRCAPKGALLFALKGQTETTPTFAPSAPSTPTLWDARDREAQSVAPEGPEGGATTLRRVSV